MEFDKGNAIGLCSTSNVKNSTSSHYMVKRPIRQKQRFSHKRLVEFVEVEVALGGTDANAKVSFRFVVFISKQEKYALRMWFSKEITLRPSGKCTATLEMLVLHKTKPSI